MKKDRKKKKLEISQCPNLISQLNSHYTCIPSFNLEMGKSLMSIWFKVILHSYLSLMLSKMKLVVNCLNFCKSLMYQNSEFDHFFEDLKQKLEF